MTDTNLNTYVAAHTEFVRTYIVNPLVEHLTGKGVQVSSDELMGVLNMPAAKTHVPAMAFGGAVPSKAIAPTVSKRNSTVIDEIIKGRCEYQFKRGQSKGRFCGKTNSPGNRYCNSCLKNRKNLDKNPVSNKPGVAPGVPGMVGYIPPTNAVPATPTTNGEPGKLSVIPYDTTRNLFKEPNHNFVVKQMEGGVIAVIGKHDDGQNMIVGLSDAEKGVARSIGLVIADTPAKTPPPKMAVPAIPAPAAATNAAVPAIPAAVPAIPAAVPAIPKAAPAVPTAGRVPQIPQIK